MKFDDVGSSVMQGDKTVSRDKGAARAISVTAIIFPLSRFAFNFPFRSHSSIQDYHGRISNGLKA